ncbi:MAG: hypothetical protein KGO96_12715 [Elusimicrobia bacterium]|nr:hypothetical protein [Elusimicrobiota bacterium]
MTPAALLKHLSQQSSPQTESEITARFGLRLTDAALCESALLRLLDDGMLCEPLGEWKGYAITDQGRAALAEMVKQVANKQTQKSMF